MKESDKYLDMLYMPHHVSTKHSQMPIINRAAQFSPFSALPGYEDNIKESTRITSAKIELDIDAKKDLDNKLQILRLNLDKKPILEICHFIPDSSKKGGSYATTKDYIVKIDDIHSIVEISNGKRIPISDIHSLDGDIFKAFW